MQIVIIFHTIPRSSLPEYLSTFIFIFINNSLKKKNINSYCKAYI